MKTPVRGAFEIGPGAAAELRQGLAGQTRADAAEETRWFVTENRPAGHYQRDDSAGVAGTHNRHFRPDALCPLTHAWESEMAISTVGSNGGLDPDAVVGNPKSQVAAVSERDLEPAATCVRAGVPNSLISNPVHLIPNHRMHFSRCAGD